MRLFTTSPATSSRVAGGSPSTAAAAGSGPQAGGRQLLAAARITQQWQQHREQQQGFAQRSNQDAAQVPLGLRPLTTSLSKPAQWGLMDVARRGLCAGLVAVLLAGSAPEPAAAVLALPKGQLPRTAEIALRRAIPAFNPDVKAIQDSLEDIALKLRIPQRKPWAGMAQSLADAQEVAGSDRAMLAGVLPPYEADAQQLVAEIRKGLGRLSDAIGNKDPDRTSLRVSTLLRQVGELEQMQAPGLPFNLPRQYADLPRLTGRAVVELQIKQEDGEKAKLELVLDGYSAPLGAGNFVANVLDGVYKGAKLDSSYNSVLVGDQGTEIRSLPLEILAAGDFEPQYRIPLDVQGGERPVLPLSINGAVAMANLADPNASGSGMVSSSQFFIYKFERSQAGLAGLSFDEGQFGVFGYVTQGADLLGRLGDGCVVTDARVVKGADKLVRPQASVAVAAP